MPDLAHWTLFLGATLILLIMPGPSIMYVVARGIGGGWRAAVFSSIGLALGDLLQVIATAIGLSAVLAAAPTVFAILKFAGAAYLVILGVATLVGKGARASKKLRSGVSLRLHSDRSLVVQGFLALNPKTALFFLAFLPRFIPPDAGPANIQILTFGVAFVVLGFFTNSLFGCLGVRLGNVAESNTTFHIITRFVGGGILIALGVFAACVESSRVPSADCTEVVGFPAELAL